MENTTEDFVIARLKNTYKPLYFARETENAQWADHIDDIFEPNCWFISIKDAMDAIQQYELKIESYIFFEVKIITTVENYTKTIKIEGLV